MILSWWWQWSWHSNAQIDMQLANCDKIYTSLAVSEIWRILQHLEILGNLGILVLWCYQMFAYTYGGHVLSDLDEKKLEQQVLLQGFYDFKNFACEEFPVPIENFINRCLGLLVYDMEFRVTWTISTQWPLCIWVIRTNTKSATEVIPRIKTPGLFTITSVKRSQLWGLFD